MSSTGEKTKKKENKKHDGNYEDKSKHSHRNESDEFSKNPKQTSSNNTKHKSKDENRKKKNSQSSPNESIASSQTNNIDNDQNEKLTSKQKKKSQEDEDIDSIYNRFVFPNKPKKSVRFHNEIKVNHYPVESDISEENEKSTFDLEKFGNDKQYGEIIRCKTRAQLAKIKVELISEIDDNLKKTKNKKHVEVKVKTLTQKIKLVMDIEKKIQEEEEEEKEEKKRNAALLKYKNEQNKKQQQDKSETWALVKHSKSHDRDWTSWLFDHVHGEKKINLLIYFNLSNSEHPTATDIHHKISTFLKNNFFIEKKIKASILFKDFSNSFRIYDVDKSTFQNVPGKDIHECLFNLDWNVNFINIILHVKNSNDQQQLFNAHDIKHDYLSYFNRLGIVTFRLNVRYHFCSFGYSYYQFDYTKHSNIKFEINYLQELFNLKLFAEIIEFRIRKYCYDELFILKRTLNTDYHLNLFESKNFSSQSTNRLPERIDGRIYSFDSNNNEDNITLYFNRKSNQVNGKIIYEFVSGYNMPFSNSFYWIEYIDNFEIIAGLRDQYLTAKEYIDIYDRKCQKEKFKLCKTFFIKDRSGSIYLANKSYLNIENSSLTLDNDLYWTSKRYFMKSFTHFTYQESKHELIVKDLRPILIFNFMNSVDHIIITEPIVFSAKYPNRYMASNLSSKGIDDFLKKHKCNDDCAKLGLKKF